MQNIVNAVKLCVNNLSINPEPCQLDVAAVERLKDYSSKLCKAYDELSDKYSRLSLNMSMIQEDARKALSVSPTLPETSEKSFPPKGEGKTISYKALDMLWNAFKEIYGGVEGRPYSDPIPSKVTIDWDAERKRIIDEMEDEALIEVQKATGAVTQRCSEALKITDWKVDKAIHWLKLSDLKYMGYKNDFDNEQALIACKDSVGDASFYLFVQAQGCRTADKIEALMQLTKCTQDTADICLQMYSGDWYKALTHIRETCEKSFPPKGEGKEASNSAESIQDPVIYNSVQSQKADTYTEPFVNPPDEHSLLTAKLHLDTKASLELCYNALELNKWDYENAKNALVCYKQLFDTVNKKR